jgi:hypothetical protein
MDDSNQLATPVELESRAEPERRTAQCPPARLPRLLSNFRKHRSQRDPRTACTPQSSLGVPRHSRTSCEIGGTPASLVPEEWPRFPLRLQTKAIPYENEHQVSYKFGTGGR